MADFPTCFTWVMVSEDPTGAHATVRDLCPSGCPGPCFAISGINSGVFPSQFKAINAIPPAQRGPAVEHFYLTNFWNNWYAQLATNDLAKRVMDEAVNAGPGTAVRILQHAINAVYSPMIPVDGQWGPTTIAAANAAGQPELLAAFIEMRVAHYRAIEEENPADAGDLPGWLDRAER